MAKIRFQALSEAQALPLKGLHFDGRKDSTWIEERVDTKRYTRKAKEERLCLIEELGSRYIIHLSPSFGTAIQISSIIIGYFKGITRDLSQLLAIGCDGTSVNIGWKSGVIRCLELKLGKPLQWRQLDIIHEPTHPQEIESKQRIRLESHPRQAKTREDVLWGRTRYSTLCSYRKNFVTVAKGATPQVTADKSGQRRLVGSVTGKANGASFF
ncbi:hypothetical protein AVEN_23886-1 [Araneus ventricosus]|uniref:Uncharacterized protein n=1 Tax=Araneus ventricosus TaxID=182803 RepID=A0A4Y2FFX6_ARAVE|nr:hypothetical protein AVEN_23886-1 [Araneus ventricosus]